MRKRLTVIVIIEYNRFDDKKWSPKGRPFFFAYREGKDCLEQSFAFPPSVAFIGNEREHGCGSVACGFFRKNLKLT